ncbi:MAG: hypothetical protein A4E66_02717 [Syntrophus sp. PtaB.Bin001]|nr:MAG: hypothetical protein A4E66_02717 [Syntrophus sp. PtaB.Bin001]
MKTFYSLVFSPIMILLLLATPAISSSDWVEYGKSKNGDIYSYHPGSIKQKSKDIVYVWVKLVFSDRGRKDYINRLEKNGELTEGYDKLSHTLSLVEIDKKRSKLRILYGLEYDMDDKELFRGSHDAPWKDILPDSTEDILRKNILK